MELTSEQREIVEAALRRYAPGYYKSDHNTAAREKSIAVDIADAIRIAHTVRID